MFFTYILILVVKDLLLTNYFLLNQYKWTAAVSRYESAFLCLMLYLCLSSALPCGFSFALPLVLNKLVILYITVSRLKSCMFVKSLCFVCYMPFWCLCCSSVEVNRCDSRVKGECIILVCCQVCCGQVFLKLNCSSASLWRGMLVMRWLYLLQTDLQQGLSDLFFGWFPVRLVIIVTGAGIKVPPLRLSDLKSPAVKLHVQVCV